MIEGFPWAPFGKSLRRGMRLARTAVDLAAFFARGRALGVRPAIGRTPGPEAVTVVGPTEDHSPQFKEIRNATVVSHQEYVVMKGTSLFFGVPTDALDPHRYLPQRWVARIDVDICFGFLLAQRPNYYHDIKEIFFQIYRLNRECSASIPILICGRTAPRDRDLLAALRITNLRIEVPAHVAVHVKRYLVLNRAHEFFLHPPRNDDERATDRRFQEYVDTITAAFAPRVAADPARKIFVTRRPPATRVPANIDAVEAIFRRRGYEIVDFARRSLAEQVAIAAGVGTFAGLHGAGLANLFFARPGTRVLEIFSHRWSADCYEVLCAKLGHRYSLVVLDPGAPSGEEGTVPLPAIDAALARFDEQDVTGATATPEARIAGWR